MLYNFVWCFLFHFASCYFTFPVCKCLLQSCHWFNRYLTAQIPSSKTSWANDHIWSCMGGIYQVPDRQVSHKHFPNIHDRCSWSWSRKKHFFMFSLKNDGEQMRKSSITIHISSECAKTHIKQTNKQTKNLDMWKKCGKVFMVCSWGGTKSRANVQVVVVILNVYFWNLHRRGHHAHAAVVLWLIESPLFFLYGKWIVFSKVDFIFTKKK